MAERENLVERVGRIVEYGISRYLGMYLQHTRTQDSEKISSASLERPHPQSAGTTKSQRRVGTRKRPKKNIVR